MSDFTPLWFTVYIPRSKPDDPDPFDEFGLSIGYGDKITPDLTKGECLEEVARVLLNRTCRDGVHGGRVRPRFWQGRSIHILIFGTTFLAKYGSGYEFVEQDSLQILLKVADILRDEG